MTHRSRRGIALILVMFIVALVSIIVVNLTYSGYLAARLNNATTRTLQAEYLLKSTINFARVMIHEDTSPEDAPQDIWAQFANGQAVPTEMLGIEEPGIQVMLEINPEEAKLPIREIIAGEGGRVEPKWRDVFVRLFKKLGFDEDKEVDHTRLFPDRHFVSEEMVANLIDYMDSDSDSYEDSNFPAVGVEAGAGIPKGRFPNTRIKRIGELSNIPGFSPARLRKLQPLITVFGASRININLAPRIVLAAMDESIDEPMIDTIISERQKEAFDDVNKNDRFRSILGDAIYNNILTMIDTKSRWFQVLAKVDYTTTSYFMRSYVSKSNDGDLPVIRSVELF